jgi:hypothetical protein
MSESIRKYIQIIADLRNENILTNKKDFTGQIGEWLVEQIFDGKRATSAVQEGWDVEVNGRFIQVKTHSKDEHNKTRWTSICSTPACNVDELIIIVFSHHYKLLEFYQVPWGIAKTKIKMNAKKNRETLRWSELKENKKEIGELPMQKVVGLFR